MSIRHYLFPEDADPQRLSHRLVQGLIFGQDSLPQFANTRQKVASVTLENDGMKPVRILNTHGSYWEFDREGGISEGLQRALGEYMEIAFGEPSNAQTVVELRPKLAKKRLDEEHRWDVGRSEINRIIADIWPKGKSGRLTAVQGVLPKRPPLTYEAGRALDEASEGFWKIGNAIERLKEPSLKGFAFEARKRSGSNPEDGFLFRALAEMAERRLEILRRRRVGKGTWYALLDVARWEDGVGTSTQIYHEQCAGKTAAIEAARRLLAEHAGKFDDNITVEAEVLTDLEWQARHRDSESR